MSVNSGGSRPLAKRGVVGGGGGGDFCPVCHFFFFQSKIMGRGGGGWPPRASHLQWATKVVETVDCSISLILCQIRFILRANPPPPFQCCTGKRQILETGNTTLRRGEGVVL